MTDTLFTNVRVLDGSGRAPFAGTVRVRGRRIEAVTEGPALAEPGQAAVIDGGGATLMPGLVEPHAHISFCDTVSLEALGEIPPEEHTLEAMKFARVMLDQGFTALFSAAAAKPRLDVVIRNAIEAGDIPGPRMRAASPELTVTGGLGDIRRQHLHRDTCTIVCDGADAFRRTAREMIREGVDTVKINPSGDEFMPFARAHHTVMNEAEIAAVCEVAASRGKTVAAHARSAESVKLCLKHGVEVIYHATLLDEEALDLLEAQRGRVFVAPTLGINWVTSTGEAASWGIGRDHPLAVMHGRELEKGIESMKALKARGVRVLPGGDYGFAWTPHGQNAKDLEYFVDMVGMSPMEALVSATRLGGQIMGRPNELGQVKAGYLADLLLVDGDPVANIRILQDKNRILAVMKDGSFHRAPDATPQRNRIAV